MQKKCGCTRLDTMTARQTITEAIRARRVMPLAAASGVHFTRIYAFIHGSGLAPINAGKLRAAMPEVPDTVWLELQAPVSSAPTTSADVQQ